MLIPMTQDDLSDFMVRMFEDEIMTTREAGQKEYAHEDDNAFANFHRVSKDLDLDPKMVLWVYARKHADGIAAYLKGHTSQREDVTGRIKDEILYLFILWAMIESERGLELIPPVQLSVDQ